MQAFEAAQQTFDEQKKEKKVGAKLQRLQEEKVALLCSMYCLDLNTAPQMQAPDRCGSDTVMRSVRTPPMHESWVLESAIK